MFRLTTLGVVDLRDDRGHPVRDVLAQPKRVALLAFLAVEGARTPVSRDRVLALFWPESDEARARNALSQALHHVRQALGPGVVESEGPHTIGVNRERLWCDAAVFTDSLERGETELALDLYRGQFCPSLIIGGTPDLEQWLDAQRRSLQRQAFDALRAAARRSCERGDGAAAARAAARALAMHPDDEADVRTLLALLERAGDAAGALLAYKEFEHRLAAELETTPAPETRRLIDAIRRRRDAASVAAESVPAPVAAPPAPAPAATHAEPVRPGAPPPRRPALPARLAAIVLFAVTAAAIVVLVPRQREAATPVKTLAVLPFTVRGGSELGYLREGVVDLLSAKLDGAAGFRAVDPRSVIAAAHADSEAAATPEGGARIAGRLGARWFISGDLVEAAGRLEISGSLFDTQGGPTAVSTVNVSGATPALFGLLDALTSRILARLIVGRDTALTKLAAVTTSSLPALRAFLRGEQALRAGRDAQAAVAFREAADLDTTFALAQYRLALTGTWVYVPEARNPTAWAETAARHADRLTPLGRGLLTAYRAYRETRADDAERLYRGVLEGHPDNVEAWLMLGETLFHFNPLRGRPPMEAWAPFQRALALDSNAHAMLHLARLAASEGRLGALDSLVRAYLERYADAERTIEMRALRAAAHDDARERGAVASEVRRSDNIVTVGVVQAELLYAQRPDAAGQLAPALMPPAGAADQVLVIGRRMLSEAGLAMGRWGPEPAERLLGRAADRDWLLETEALLASSAFFSVPQARVASLRDSIAARRPYPSLNVLIQPTALDLSSEMRTYLLGLLSARLGDSAAARRYAAELEAVRGANVAAPSRDLARALRAEIARSSGDLAGALAQIERFTLSPTIELATQHWGVRERFLHAELLHALGRDEEALRLYDSFLGPWDLPWAAAAHYRRGEIQARLGHREHARFHYGRFVRLWKDCDPEFRPLLDQATRALALLGAPS